MRSQLRLRVVLPVAVLGLLGLGVGAFAMGGPPDSGTPGTGSTTVTTTAKEPPEGQTLSRAAWAKQVNKLCAKVQSELRAAGQPANPEQAVAFLEKYLEIARWADPALVALGWPKGQKGAVKRLWTLSATGTKTVAEMLETLRAGNRRRLLRLFERNDAQAAQGDRIMTRLGAHRCAEDTFAAANPERGLAGALDENKVVVVLFYAPGSSYDTIQAREARAGAAAAGAGFLAVDVSKDRQVSSLAAAFAVRDAPAILVVKRSFRVAVRIHGYADRETVAQAAANARA
jgi:hypothetical protein